MGQAQAMIKYEITRDLPGGTLVFKCKCNLEKGQNGSIGIFFNGTKIMGNHSKLYISLLETSGEHPVHFKLLPVHGAMNHSGTPL